MISTITLYSSPLDAVARLLLYLIDCHIIAVKNLKPQIRVPPLLRRAIRLFCLVIEWTDVGLFMPELKIIQLGNLI